ncbi:MAG: LPXTG cell wall anchor domain-containing protein [Actinomycetota bacterium]|nr:LPXTG cell wall anchor domain-containing protein [Actinomycetota bacterium]
MKKRLTVLVGMLAMLLATAVPAFAQQEPPETGEEVVVTGVVEDLGGSGPLPPYGLRDEATGGVYYLASDEVDFGTLVGQRITAHGTVEEVIRSVVLNVTRVEPADGTPQDDEATLSFELTVKGEPPAGTTFLGFIPAEGGFRAPLADPDGDGVYTGSITVPKFPPGPRPVPPGIEPVSLPVQIVQQNGGNIEVIRDFGTVLIDGDKTFKAKVNFKRDRGEITTPGETVPGSTTPDTGSGGSGSDNASGNSNPGVGGSGSSGSGYSSSGSGGEAKATGTETRTAPNAEAKAGSAKAKELPRTGGALGASLLTLGALLVGGGLLIRRATR